MSPSVRAHAHHIISGLQRHAEENLSISHSGRGRGPGGGTYGEEKMVKKKTKSF